MEIQNTFPLSLEQFNTLVDLIERNKEEIIKENEEFKNLSSEQILTRCTISNHGNLGHSPREVKINLYYPNKLPTIVREYVIKNFGVKFIA